MSSGVFQPALALSSYNLFFLQSYFLKVLLLFLHVDVKERAE